MIEIEMSRDIREFSPKIIGPFDKRQLVVIILVALVSVPIFLLTKALPLQSRLIFSIIVNLPLILCGWLKVFGMPLEVFVFKFILPTIFSPRRKKYMTENSYETLFVEEGEKNPYKANPVLRNIEKKKLTRKERLAKEAKLKQYGAAN